jgi:hypothetical protein
MIAIEVFTSAFLLARAGLEPASPLRATDFTYYYSFHCQRELPKFPSHTLIHEVKACLLLALCL